MTLKEFFNNKKPIKLGNPLAPMGDFPLINASDVIVDYDETTGKEIRLDEKLSSIGSGGSGGSVSITYDATTENLTVK